MGSRFRRGRSEKRRNTRYLVAHWCYYVLVFDVYAVGRKMKPQDYYLHEGTLFDIARHCFRREVALIRSKQGAKGDNTTHTRNLKIHNRPEAHHVINQKHKIIDKKLNLYISTMTYTHGVGEANNTYWKEHHQDHAISNDLLIDIDVKRWCDIEKAKEAAIKITAFFHQRQCPTRITFSGRGYHVVIPGRHFSPEATLKDYYKIARYLKERFSSLIDLRVYDKRRVMKCPCSLAFYRNYTAVCHPFKDRNELIKLSPDQMLLENYGSEMGFRTHNEPLSLAWGVHKIEKQILGDGTTRRRNPKDI